MDEIDKRRMTLSQALAETRLLSLVMPTICVSFGVAGWVLRVRFGASSTELIVIVSVAFAVVLVSVFLAIRRHRIGRNPFCTMTPGGNIDIRASRREVAVSVPLTVAGLASTYFFIAERPQYVLAALAAGIALWQLMRWLLRVAVR